MSTHSWYKLALLHHFLQLLPLGGSLGNLLSQEVTSRQVCEPKVLHYTITLGALTTPRATCVEGCMVLKFCTFCTDSLLQ